MNRKSSHGPMRFAYSMSALLVPAFSHAQASASSEGRGEWWNAYFGAPLVQKAVVLAGLPIAWLLGTLLFSQLLATQSPNPAGRFGCLGILIAFLAYQFLVAALYLRVTFPSYLYIAVGAGLLVVIVLTFLKKD